MSKKLSIILRGHIRSSFNDKTLYNYVKRLAGEYDLKIYIQTWNIIQSDVSWRHMEKNESPVTESTIISYFSDLSNLIQKIIILDDKQINVIGQTIGRMGKTAGSYLGWKRMWYGIYEIVSYLKYVDPEPDNFVINTRFDVFNNSVSFSLNSINDKLKTVMNSINEPSSIGKNIFLKDVEFFGMDNFYIGNVNTILRLTEQFNYNLDEIVKKHPRVTSHEFYTYHVNNTLVINKLPGSNKNLTMTTPSLIKPIEPIDITPKVIDIPSTITQNPILSNSSHYQNNKMQLFDKSVSTNNVDNNLRIFDKNDEPPILMTSESKNFPILKPSSHGKNNKIPLLDTPDKVNDPDVVIKNDGVNQIPVLQPYLHGRNNKMQLIDNPDIVNDQTDFTITDGLNQIPVLKSSSHGRNNKMQLFDPNESVKNTAISSVNTDGNLIPVLPPSSHGRNNKMQLFDQNESVKNTVASITIHDNSLPIMQPSSHSRNNKMPLTDSTNAVTTSTLIITPQLSTLSSAAPNKSVNKMELFDSNPIIDPNTYVVNAEKQTALVSTNIARRGSVPLVDASIKNNNSIKMAYNDLPLLSSNSQTYRSTKPLINIDRNTNTLTNNSIISGMVLVNANIRNNTTSMGNVKEQPIPVIEQPVPVIEQPVPVIEQPVPVIEQPVPVIEKTKSLETKYKNNSTKYISKPIPISKFSVSLDPNYLNLDNIIPVPTVLNISDNTKLIHSNKFKTNTQSLSAYYALLSQ